MTRSYFADIFPLFKSGNQTKTSFTYNKLFKIMMPQAPADMIPVFNESFSCKRRWMESVFSNCFVHVSEAKLVIKVRLGMLQNEMITYFVIILALLGVLSNLIS